MKLTTSRPENFGYYFALNIVFLFVMTIFNSRFVRRIGALNMFRSGLWIQFIMAAWMVISALLGLGFWSLVVGVAAFVGCVSMVSSNAMAVILDEFPPYGGNGIFAGRNLPFWHRGNCWRIAFSCDL
ncbi:bicyclomycin resistance protein [Escherichia coli]|uniref:Bicyclomycin resistance protein n=1 Tax=Escherichia coli TaxID=562 RepID=A0A376KQX2_ECOLX|nr:bicyclomycin resistance protein [Escherichia coli]